MQQQPEKQREEELPPTAPPQSSSRVASGSTTSDGHKKIPSYLQGTSSSRSRSQSFDKNKSSVQKQQLQKPNTPSRSTSLDPTGMFRNRGRRVITTSSSSSAAAAANRNDNMVSNYLTQQIITSRQRDQTTQQLAKEYIDKYGNERNSPLMVEEGHEHSTMSYQSAKDCIVNDNNKAEEHKEKDESIKEEEMEQNDESDNDDLVLRERDDNPNNNDSVTACDESGEFVPTITLESLKRFDFQDSSKDADQLLSSLHNNGGMVNRSLSNDSSDNEQNNSTIGSTVSVMGSLVGENEGTTIGSGSFGYDESRLLAVKRRMMQDVEEIVELDENDMSDDDDDTRDDEDDRPMLEGSLLLHSLSDKIENDAAVNESMECNAEEARNEEDHASESMTDDDVSENVQTVVASNDDGTITYSSGIDDINNIKTTSTIHDESPLRAAFRRKTQSMTNSLPPMPSHLSALTPNRFHSSYAKTENAVASGFKVAQQCFSFEDTTVDDSNFLQPEKLNAGGGDGGVQRPTHKYGLLGVASFASEDDGSSSVEKNTPKRNPAVAKKSAARPNWYPPMSGGGTLLSPKVIRHRQVWDDNSQIRQSAPWNGNDGIRLSSSFDPSPSSKRDTKMEANRNEAVTLLRSIVMQSSHFEQDEKALNIQSLHCENCQLHLGNESAETSTSYYNCSSCLKKIKSIANSIKRGSSESDDNSDDNNHEPTFDSSIVDLLMQSHEYAIKMKQSTLLSRKWLESIEAESRGIVPSTAHAPLDVTDESLETAERTIIIKQEEISRLNKELSQCRAEIGRLKCSPREQQMPTLTLNKSILSDSSSDNSEIDGNNSLNLTSPFPTVKYCDSHDESYIRFEKRIEADMHLENRKEIIFLKAALEKANKKISALEHDSETFHDKEEPFKSEIEAIDTSNTMEGTDDLIIQIAESIENFSVGSSLPADEEEAHSNNPYSVSLEDPALEKELEEYRTALIESLCVEETNKSTAEPSTAASTNVDKDSSNTIPSELPSDKRMVNVRMIDGENFTTEWGDLVEPLPPPPDHGLKSPIVDAILSKWTDDSSTQSALIKWIENVLNGTSSDDAPSLKLSGLDHQIRDGFIMHVLPLLLLRKDIHVNVTSRAHRQTTYDIAVSISQSVKGSINYINNNRHEDRILEESAHRSKPGGRKHQLMAYQAARSGSAVNNNGGKEDSNIAPFSARQFLGRTVPDIVRTASHTESISTAVTAQISNRTPSQAAKNLFRSQAAEDSYTAFSEMKTPNRIPNVPPPALGDDLSVGSSASDDESKSQRQSSIMGSISGAFGGLLSRRKGLNPSDLYQPGSDKSPSINSSSWSPPAFFTPQPNHSQEELRHDDIYHRVVSAPPGKIGLTFVEYEGNAMVSNVSDSSPLSGWVFPSDVLVAIDDTPVRDLRTRDIVQLLTEKKGQQRNLRMYSLTRR